MCFAPQRRAIWPTCSAPTALARLLFGPPEPQIIGETQWIATFLPFHAPASSLFWLSPSLIFSSLTLPTSAFPSVHIVGSLTSKLPSIISFLFIIWTIINTFSTYNISCLYSLHSLCNNNTRVTCSSAHSGHPSSSIYHYCRLWFVLLVIIWFLFILELLLLLS